jgi:SAM-dependent methyltransferase
MVVDSQKAAFLAGEGDQWFERNARKMAADPAQDLIIAELKQVRLAPTRVLEIGCSNGWRLEAMRKVWGCAAFGIDPSAKAVQEGAAVFPDLVLKTGTAEALPFADHNFDLVVLGFCLYLCDRGDLFRIAQEVDRALADGGHLAILDFFSAIPYRNRYAHLAGVYAYKMDYAAMFAWNPAYTLLRQTKLSHDGQRGGVPSRDDLIAVSVLRKDEAAAYVENPY